MLVVLNHPSLHFENVLRCYSSFINVSLFSFSLPSRISCKVKLTIFLIFLLIFFTLLVCQLVAMNEFRLHELCFFVVQR